MSGARQAVLDYLATVAGEGIRLGLDRAAAVAGRMGNPQRTYPVIQVAGTNGKGSVAATITTVLSAAGFRTGFHLSPHLREVNERIRIGMEPVGYGLLLDDLEAVREAGAAEGVTPTYFEALTLAAYRRFALEEVDCAVVEVGMGGRLDATSIATPKLAVITEIDRDHMEHLGNTLETIAREKTAIGGPGVPTVIGTRKRALGRKMREMVAENGGVPEVVAQGCLGRLISMDLAGQTVELVTPKGHYGEVRMSLIGQHQLDNLLTATRALEILSSIGFPITERVYRDGVRGVCWPGRFEVRSRDPLVILDGAHNPAGVAELGRTCRRLFGDGRAIVILAPLAGKNLIGMLSLISTWAGRIIVTRVEGPRGIDPRSIPTTVGNLAGIVRTATTLDSAIRDALRDLRPGEPLIVTGSLAGLGEAAATLDGILGETKGGR